MLELPFIWLEPVWKRRKFTFFCGIRVDRQGDAKVFIGHDDGGNIPIGFWNRRSGVQDELLVSVRAFCITAKLFVVLMS